MSTPCSAAAPTPLTAILFASWPAGADDRPLGAQNILLPLIDRPMLQAVVERLVHFGVQDIHVVLGDDPRPVKSFLASGSRWGCRVTYHQPSEGEGLRGVMRRVGVKPDCDYVLTAASRVPQQRDAWPEAGDGAHAGRIDVWHAEGSSRWSGWGVFDGTWLLARDIDLDMESFEAAVLQDTSIARRYSPAPLSAATHVELLESALRLVPRHANGRRGNCDVHPEARIVEPVYLGRQVKIGAGAVIGPNVVLGDGAFVDRRSVLRNSVIMPNTYVGESLELDRVVANGRQLAHLRLDTVLRIADRHLLAPLPGSGTREHRVATGEKVLAAALRLALAPLQALACVLDRAGAPSRPFVAHFRRSFYPGLLAVQRGECHLVGPALREGEDADDAPWRELHPDARPGLLSDAALEVPSGLGPEIEFASDAVACVQQGKARPTLRLLARYLSRVAQDVYPRAIGARFIGPATR